MSPSYLQNYFFSGRKWAGTGSRRLVDSSDTVTSDLQTVTVSHNLMSKNLNYPFNPCAFFGSRKEEGRKEECVTIHLKGIVHVFGHEVV